MGPAINIRWTRIGDLDKPPETRIANSLGVGESDRIPNDVGDLEKCSSFTVEFESLSGKKYQTITKWPAGAKETTFHESKSDR